jgi:hypothetical protein
MAVRNLRTNSLCSRAALMVYIFLDRLIEKSPVMSSIKRGSSSMRIQEIVKVVLGAVAFTMIGTAARADVAPGPDECDLGHYHYDNYACVVCSVGDTDGGCEAKYGPQNYTWKCSTEPEGGADSEEVWCKPSPGTKGPASRIGEDDSDSGCEVILVPSTRGDTARIYLAAAFLIIAAGRRFGSRRTKK